MKIKDIFSNKRIKQMMPNFKVAWVYRAKLFNHTVVLDSKDKAEKQVLSDVRKQLENAYDRSIRWTPKGTVFILNYCYGWQYEIIRRGSKCGSLCCLTCKTHTEALEQMKRHIEQFDE